MKTIRFMTKRLIFKTMAVAAIAAAALGGSAKAQGVFNPCPDIIINERVDHVPYEIYQEQGWDTVINRDNHGMIMLTAEPYIPVQYFNGTYAVEQIPYNPPDTTFYLNYNPATDANNPLKKKLAISSDDAWAPGYVDIAFPFYFFGIRKNQFLLGDNGIVTFAKPTGYNGGQGCPYATTTPLPWPNSVPTSTSASGSLPSPDLMRDAIYGVYEDTYTGSGGSYMSGLQGIYYGVIDNPPCRKIIASWYQIPVFSNQDKRQTYQIVCYEGSNIIEIHVKKRNCCPSTNGHNGLIGIQNATGASQVRGAPGSPNMKVVTGSPAAFWPTGYNVFQDELDTVAFRFTPLGETQKTITWYRVFDDGRDSVVLTENVNDTNGYYEPMHDNPNVAGYDPVHPTLTKAWVRPTIPSTYVMKLYFEDAEQNTYTLYDTIRIGIDTANDLYLKYHTGMSSTDDTVRIKDVCNGQTATLDLSWGETLTPRDIRWRFHRILDGQLIELPETMYEIDEVANTVSVLPDPNFNTLPKNKIDSIRVMASVDFISGSNNYDTFLVRVFPIFDTTNIDGICRGETYHWRPSDTHGNSHDISYTIETDPAANLVHLLSRPGCDSTVRLKLTVYDVSLTIDTVASCREYTWRNGHTYTANNWETMANDTVVLKNRYDCDSIVQLFFTIYPLKAVIDCDVEKFTYDNLDAQLNDVSQGLEATRMWRMPALDANGDSTTIESADPMVYYNLPAKLDGATIKLIATSPYGCQDSTTIYIPMEKETMWIPTAFMPDEASNNNIFKSHSIATEQQEMWIYDRNGRLVAHCAGVDCGWNGRDLKGNPCPQGAYVYVIKYTTVFQPTKTLTKHGSVTLIR